MDDKPDAVIMHLGNNDIRNNVNHKNIARNILKIGLTFASQCRKMVRHTLKNHDQDFKSVSDHFTSLRSKGLNCKNWC